MLSYLLSPYQRLFSFQYLLYRKRIKHYLNINTIQPIWYPLYHFKINTIIRYIEVYGLVTYARAYGSRAILKNLNRLRNSAVIELPSGLIKVFSCFTFSIKIAKKVKLKQVWSNKAGFWVRYGTKPQSRGIAKNPVDHPHGGRTNTIRYPRTP